MFIRENQDEEAIVNTALNQIRGNLVRAQKETEELKKVYPTNICLNNLYQDTTANEAEYMRQICNLKQRTQLDPCILLYDDDFDNLDELYEATLNEVENDSVCYNIEMEGCRIANSISSNKDRNDVLIPIMQQRSVLVDLRKSIENSMSKLDLSDNMTLEPIVPVDETTTELYESNCIKKIQYSINLSKELVEYVGVVNEEIVKASEEKEFITKWMNLILDIFQVYLRDDDNDEDIADMLMDKSLLSGVEELESKMKSKIEQYSRSEALCPFKFSIDVNEEDEYVYNFKLTGERYSPFRDDGTYKTRTDVAPLEMSIVHKKDGDVKLKFQCYQKMKELHQQYKSAIQQREEQAQLQYFIDTLGKRVKNFPDRYEDVTRLMSHFLRM